MPEHPLHTLRQAGYSVIPCFTRGKEPMVAWQPYQLELPTDDTVAQWARQWPQCNVGIVTGRVSRLVVFDVDGSEGAISAAHIGLAGHKTLTVKTARGWHYYFRYPDTAPIAGIRNRAGIRTGLDVRAEGGYVLAPPSIHPTGHTYRWIDFTRGKTAQPDDLPTPLLELLLERTEERRGVRGEERTPPVGESATQPVQNGAAYGAAALKGEQSKILRATVGVRNDQLNRSACKIGSLVGGGILPYSEAEHALVAAAVAAGLPESEARRTVASGMKRGIANPRTVTLHPPNHA